MATNLEKILVRCPDWQTCTDYSKCSHKRMHKPDINCYQKAEGSIRLEICPDCRVEEK